MKLLERLRRCYYGPQPDIDEARQTMHWGDIPIPPAKRPLVLWIEKRGVPRLLALWGAFAAIVAVAAAVSGMFR